MNGVADLSALLKGQLKLLATGGTVPAEGTSANPTSGEALPEVETSGPSSAVLSSEKRRKKKKSGKKRSRDDSVNVGEGEPADSLNIAVPDPSEEIIPSEPLEKKKRRKKKKGGDDPVMMDNSAAEPSSGDAPIERTSVSPTITSSRREGSPVREAAVKNPEPPRLATNRSAVGPLGSSQSAPVLGESASGSFSIQRLPPDFRDRVNFSYYERTPLIFNPPQCAELTRQIKGAPDGLPPVQELAFKELYTEAACAVKRVSLPIVFSLLLKV